MDRNKNVPVEHLSDIFVCDKCGTVEQIRTGYYPTYHGIKLFSDESLLLMDLCSTCVPIYLHDNSPSGYIGTWHNKFPKKSWEKWGYPSVINRTKKVEL